MTLLVRISRVIVHNLAWKLFALVLALVVWILVASEPEYSAFDTARVVYRDLPDDLEISSDPVPAVTLELRGPSSELRNLEGPQRPAAVLDMSDAVAGERTYTIEDGAVHLPRGVYLLRSIPSEIRFRFEKRGTRLVPVIARFSGGRAAELAPGAVTVQPAMLQITGPESHVSRVKSVATDAVDLSTQASVVTERVNAYVDDPFVRFVASPQVTVSVVLPKR
ncbi:MAG: YbbR-like domain-containing protein [Bryobacteraceae bacterium]